MAHSTVPSGPPPDVPERNVMAEYDYSNFFYSASDDLFTIFGAYDDWWNGYAREHGYYQFYQPMSDRKSTRLNSSHQ